MKSSSKDPIHFPLTIYGGVPGALALFGLAFCVVFIVVFSQLTGDTVPLSLWLISGFGALFLFFIGMLFLMNRIRIDEKSLSMSIMRGNIFSPPYLEIPWDTIRKIDVAQKDVNAGGAYGRFKVKLIQIFHGSKDTPILINVTFFKSNPQWPVIRKAILERVPATRITDSASRILGHEKAR